MPNRTHDADFQGSFFSLEVDGVEIAYFTGCSGLGLEYDVVTFKQGDGKQVLQSKRPGKPKYSEVVLKRGFTSNTKLYDWFDEVVKAAENPPYKTASIVIFDRTAKEVARFNMEECWPNKLSVSDLQSGSDEVMVEEITIQHEFLDWV
jgi:phage tail-like protein